MTVATLIDELAERAPAEGLDPVEAALLERYQRNFPLAPRPYAEIARELGVGEDAVLAALGRLRERGVLSRVGAVVRPNSVGCSTLAAMAVPADRLECVAALVGAYQEVNHNYEREHRFNLWFVVTAADAERLGEVIAEIEARTGLAVLDLPLVEAYHIDLGFPLR